jgi:type II secretory ATPase GspE/PulE/Tfp pilus assembly ATPase PilB-like protein
MSSTVLQSTLALADSFTTEYLEYYGILPLEKSETVLRVAVAGVVRQEVLDDLRTSFHCDLELISVDRELLADGIRRSFIAGESVVELVRDLSASAVDVAEADDASTDVRALANQPPVIRFVNLLIREAHQARASDIHLESTVAGLRVRLRIDGVLTELPAPPRNLQLAVVSRIKLLAQLDIAERHVPLDGRIRVRLEERELDLRVATVPTLHGESVVIRLLDQGGRPTHLSELGMSDRILEAFARLAQLPHGLILSTGPTGSGKTTTLYAALGLRDAGAEKIISVEDPVEYHVPGVTQMPVNSAAGLTFASALRSILRQDPDVLMVGEMRDAETSSIAIQAAMTGHLVFSTLHTNDAVSALARLTDLQVEPYMIAATVEGILAQRLVRRTCAACRSRYEPDPALVATIAGRPVGAMVLERGIGCTECRHTGFRGRVGLFELLVMSDRLRSELSTTTDITQLRRVSLDEGLQSLRADAWTKVQAGLTTVEEVIRVIQD